MVRTLDQRMQTPGRAAAFFNKAWWMALIEGIVAVGVGLFLLFRPVNTIVFLVQALGIYWLVSGIFKSSASLFGSKTQGWWTNLVGGILLALIGIGVLSYPLFSAALSVFTLTMVLASVAVVGGIMAMVYGFAMASEYAGEGWSILSGLLSVILGIGLFSAPFVALRALEVMIGVFAIIGGLGQISFSFRMRSLGKRIRERIEEERHTERYARQP